MEFVLHHQASSSTSKLDEHLCLLQKQTDPQTRPTAHELIESLAELAQGTQALRAALMLSLAARVVVKSDLTLEDVEMRIPQILQLPLLLHVRKLVRTLDPDSRAEWECHMNRWVLRTVVRGIDPSQGGRQLPGAPLDEDDEDVRNPKTAAKQLSALVTQNARLVQQRSSGGISQSEEVDLPLVCVTSHDLAEWHLHLGELKRAEELFRMSLTIIHQLNISTNSPNPTHQVSKTGRRCTVRPERLSALALALQMLRISQKDAPPTPQVAGVGKKFIGDEASSAAAGSSSEVPIPSSAVMMLTAELLRLAGQKTRLIQLIHLDNVLRLCRGLMTQDPTCACAYATVGPPASATPAEGGDAREVVPLPWAYREHLCAWLIELGGAGESGHDLAREAAAANCLVTLTSSPAVPALVCLKMLQSPSLYTASSAAGHGAGGGERERIASERQRSIALALEALNQTSSMLESAEDPERRRDLITGVFPEHLPQALALTECLIKAVASAADAGALVAVRSGLCRTRKVLEAAARVHESAVGEDDAEAAPAAAAAGWKERIQSSSALAAFLRSGRREWGREVGVGASGKRRRRTGDRDAMESMKKRACLSDAILVAWFPRESGDGMDMEEASPSRAGAAGGSLEGVVERNQVAVQLTEMKSCCKRLGASAVQWAAAMQGKGEAEEEGEARGAFDTVEQSLREIVRVAVRACGGGLMLAHASEYPHRAWFAALSGGAPVPPPSLG
jgi:hypothetical protein